MLDAKAPRDSNFEEWTGSGTSSVSGYELEQGLRLMNLIDH
jgi:hypothetical protein